MASASVPLGMVIFAAKVPVCASVVRECFGSWLPELAALQQCGRAEPVPPATSRLWLRRLFLARGAWRWWWGRGDGRVCGAGDHLLNGAHGRPGRCR